MNLLYEYILAVVFLLNPNAAPLPIASAVDKIECQKKAGQTALQPEAKDFLNRPEVAAQGGALVCLKIELPKV